MTGPTVHTRSEALDLVATSLQRSEHRLPGVTQLAQGGFRRVIGEMEDVRADRQRSVHAAQQAFDEAKASDGDVAGCARVLDAAKQLLQRADDHLRAAREASSRHERAASRLQHEVSHIVSRALGQLASMTDAVDRYQASSRVMSAALGATALTGAIGAADRTDAGSTALDDALAERGFVNVDVRAPDYADNPVIDYVKAKRSDYRWAVEKWDSVVAPGVANGFERADFEAMDGTSGAGDMRRLAMVYDWMLGDDAILLNHNPDGSVGVTNGRHRLDVARALGIANLPARFT